jgi:hypothetical protein
MDSALLRTGEKRNAYRILLRNREGKRPLRRVDVSGRIIHCIKTVLRETE